MLYYELHRLPVVFVIDLRDTGYKDTFNRGAERIAKERRNSEADTCLFTGASQCNIFQILRCFIGSNRFLKHYKYMWNISNKVWLCVVDKTVRM